MRLYEITGALAELEAALGETETEEEIQALLSQLQAVELARDEKLSGCVALIKNWSAMVKALRDEEISLAARRQALANKAEKLTNYVASALPQGEKWEQGPHALGWRKSQFLEVVGEPESFPEEYRRVTVALDKTALTKAVKEGYRIPGVTLKERHSLQVK